MAYEVKPNTGSLFANKEKKSEKSPDYQGSVLVDIDTLEVVNGKATIKLAGWKRVSASGITFLSLSVDTYKPEVKPAVQPRAKSIQDMDDDLPF